MRIRAMINSAHCLIYCPTRLNYPTRPSGRSILHSPFSILHSPFSTLLSLLTEGQNLLFAVAHKHG